MSQSDHFTQSTGLELEEADVATLNSTIVLEKESKPKTQPTSLCPISNHITGTPAALNALIDWKQGTFVLLV